MSTPRRNTAPSQAVDAIDLEIAEEAADFYADPLGFVMWAFDWGHGELEHQTGPDVWQTDMLLSVAQAIVTEPFDGHTPTHPRQFAVSSGHGIGKSAYTAWILLWLLTTRPGCKGIVTANTSDQLRTKTWAELSKWRNLCVTGHWFEYSNSRGNMCMYHRSDPENWRVDAQTCREENSEAFAGLHAAHSSPFYIFDEASNVPEKIWEVAEGGKTDGEPFHFVFGNPTRKTGGFFECFHKQAHRWNTFRVDSRNAKMTNKEQIAKWQEDWGEDSDFFRVRVRGEFPRASDMQFIPHDIVTMAAKKDPQSLDDDPLVCGIDVARGGADDNMIQFRKGQDAKSFKSYRIPGEHTRDTSRFVALVSDILTRLKPDIVTIDATGIGGPLGDRLRQMGFDVYDIHFGEKALNSGQFRNRAAEMWYRMRQWLLAGGAIKDHPDLRDQLTGRLFDHDDKDRLVLERKKDMRKRGLGSPDWADALALTFAVSTLPRTDRAPRRQRPHSHNALEWDYNPLDSV